jgi:hypothetical protein
MPKWKATPVDTYAKLKPLLEKKYMIPSGSLSDKINKVRQAVVSLEFACDFINNDNNKVNLAPYGHKRDQ